MTGPTNLRELRLFSAGQFAGMRNVYVAMARGAKGALRKAYIKSARGLHWTYMARMREARAAALGLTVGYRVPDLGVTNAAYELPAVEPGFMFRRQA